MDREKCTEGHGDCSGHRVEGATAYLADRFSPSPTDSSSIRIVLIKNRLLSSMDSTLVSLLTTRLLFLK